MAQYRYLLYDLLTNTPITELPLTGVSFTEQLNSAGTFSATLLITDSTENALSVIQGTQPARTALYVERSDLANNVGRSLVWGGIVWSRSYNSTTQSITINAREFESFLEKIRLQVSLFPISFPTGANTKAVQFTNVDQFQLVQMIMSAAQSRTGSNIGIQVPGTLSGALANVVYSDTDYKTAYQALLDLSSAQNGFDFNVDVYYDGTGTPQKILNLGYPQIGYRYVSGDPNAPVLQLPGNVLEYEYEEDGSLTANYVSAVGNNNATQSYSNAAAITAGYPFMQEVVNYSDITDTTLLSGIAQGRANALAVPPTTLKVTQIASQQPTVGVVNPGDDMRVIINDARFPNGLNAVYRVTAITTTPNESGGPEQITYSLTQPNNIY
jgi:hypothetical protein